jgi:hypothetical protein
MDHVEAIDDVMLVMRKMMTMKPVATHLAIGNVRDTTDEVRHIVQAGTETVLLTDLVEVIEIVMQDMRAMMTMKLHAEHLVNGCVTDNIDEIRLHVSNIIDDVQ